MKTKERIAETARKCFNTQGVGETSLRDIAKAAGISYGNLTYHFPSKNKLLLHLYRAMLAENAQVAAGIQPGSSLLEMVLKAPEAIFEVSCRYRFLFTDYTLILRQYEDIREDHLQFSAKRKGELGYILISLQEQGLLGPGLSPAQLDYIMEQSIAMRSFWFVRNAFQPDLAPLKTAYVQYVNGFLWPWLSPAGKAIYAEQVGAFF